MTDAAESDGLRSMASWLRGHGHLGARAAAELVGTGRALEQLPALAGAFAARAVTAAQVGLVAQIAAPERLAEAAAQGIELDVIDEAVTTVAVEQPHERLAAVVRYYRQALDPDGAEPDPTEGRRLSLARHVDGTLGLSGQLDGVGGEKLQAALEAIVQAGRCQWDTRTRAQQLADALVHSAHQGAPRLPGRTRRRRTTGPQMAHLPPRRYRDPGRDPSALAQASAAESAPRHGGSVPHCGHDVCAGSARGRRPRGVPDWQAEVCQRARPAACR